MQSSAIIQHYHGTRGGNDMCTQNKVSRDDILPPLLLL